MSLHKLSWACVSCAACQLRRVSRCSELASWGFSHVSAKASTQDNYDLVMCVRVWGCLFYRKILFFPSFFSHSSSTHCLKPVVPSVSLVCVRTCVCVRTPFKCRGRESLLCKIEEEQGRKKAEGGSK